MNKKQQKGALNQAIRSALVSYLRGREKPIETRTAISSFAALFGEPRQRIAGNISWLCLAGEITVQRNFPHSTITAP